MKEYLLPFVSLVLEMAPYLLLGFLFAGVLHAFVPGRFYTSYLSKRNFKSTLMAATIGVPLPLCSCGVIPTAMSLRRNGASKGATVSFLISTPQTGVDSILATGSLLGWVMAVIRPVAAFVTALVGGEIVNRIDTGDDNEGVTTALTDERKQGFMARVADTFHYGFVDMVQDIGKWLVIGLIIAGLITIFVPDDFFEGFNQYPLLNMLLVLVIAVPMYVCATGSIPIAMALMLKGLTPGAALVFLMAGPATNMAAIMVINKVLHRKCLIAYLATIVLGAISFGLAIDYLLPRELFTGQVLSACCHTDNFPLWKIASAIIFIILLINAFAHKHNHSHQDKMTQESNVKTYAVTGMSCNHCKANVEKALAALPGVEAYEVSLENASAHVTGNVDPRAVCDCIERLGYSCKLNDSSAQ